MTTPDPLLKDVDAWWTVVAVDPIAVPLTRALMRWPAVTPWGVTVAAHLLGLVSAAMFASGALAAGAAVYEVRFVLDCVDGKLARLTGRTSRGGAYLDFVGDGLVGGINLVALGSWSADAGHIPTWVAAALAALFVAYVWLSAARDEEARRRSVPPALTADRLPGGYRAWMRGHRLRALPSRIDAEHAVLFAAPLVAGLVDRPKVVAAALWAGTAYFLYEIVHLAVAGYRLAAGSDSTL